MTEPKNIHLQLKNISERPVDAIQSTCLLPCQVLTVEITAPSGNSVKYIGPVKDDWPGDELRTLAPGESMEDDLLIFEDFEEFKEPGEYSFKMIYHGIIGKKIESNVLKLKIQS